MRYCKTVENIMKTLILLSAFAVSVYGYSAGAPEAVCEDMTPKHPVDPQKTPLPYEISVNKKQVKANQVVEITIGKKPFKGFLMQVRDKRNRAVGSFEIPSTDRYAKTINCFAGRANAATHKNAVEKSDLKLKWKAPSTAGNYKVFVTVAEDGGTFWAKHPTQSIQVN